MSAFSKAMLGVYALTLFVSATLLFLIQLIIGKMITPLLGGTPEVWNTCMVFFQALLLAGYAYAHATTSWLGPRRQSLLHLGLLLIPLAFFPIAVNKGLIPGGEAHPIPTVLLVLSLSVGVPFFVVSTSAPLLQKWFSSTDHPAADDPYFLYGASNLGSMLALVSYPLLTEPLLTLSQQRLVWMAGYGLLLLLVGACAWLMWRTPEALPALTPVDSAPAKGKGPDDGGSPAPARGKGHVKRGAEARTDPREAATLAGEVTWLRRARWVLLAAVPSSLMLGVTTYMTTDITPMPLLWVLPLTLYLLTFIIVFSRTLEPVMQVVHKALVLIMPLMVLLLIFMMLSNVGSQLGFMNRITYKILFHLATFFVIALVCHGELARDRPPTHYLTEFYLWMSFGGVLGGLFNALFAPLAFHALIEYPLAMVAACLLLPPLSDEQGEGGWGLGIDVGLVVLFVLAGFLLIIFRVYDRDVDFAAIATAPWGWPLAGMLLFLGLGALYVARGPREQRLARSLDLVLPFALCLLTVGLIWGMNSYLLLPRLESIGRSINRSYAEVQTILTYGLPAILCYTFVERSVRFGLGVGAILMAAAFCGLFSTDYRFQERGFFGVLQVEVERTSYTEDDEVRVTHYYNRLLHGTTLHGKQYAFTLRGDEVTEMPGWRGEALTYYHETGPVGQLMDAYNRNPPGVGLAAGPLAGITGWQETTVPVGVIGLGTGTMSAYARPGQRITFYDIDPLVKKIAFDSDEYFSYVKNAQARGAQVDLILNDARLAIERQVEAMDRADPPLSEQQKEERRHGVLIVDAFSSDAIPIHLITQEALRLYLKMVRQEGIIAFHISNRYLDLQPVLANLAEAEGLVGYYESDNVESYIGKAASTWVVLARKQEYLARLTTEESFAPGRKLLLEAMLPLMCLPNPAQGLDLASQAGLAYLALSAKTRGSYSIQAPWRPLIPDPKVGIWTDDYSNLLSVFQW